MVADEVRCQWVEYLGVLTDRLDPVCYGDPRFAADRTAGTLARRPRLAMNNHERAVLRGLADDVHDPITRDADDVLGSVVAAVL